MASPQYHRRAIYGDPSGGLCRELRAVLALFATTPSPKAQRAYNIFIERLKGDGSATSFWERCSSIQIYGTETQALIDWRQPGVLVPTLNHGAGADPTFAAGRGFTFDGTQNWVDTMFNPASDTRARWHQNGAFFGGRVLSNNTSNTALLGWFDGTNGCSLNPRTTADIFTALVNQATTVNGTANAQTTSAGFWVARRSSSTSVGAFKNGVAQTTASGSTTASATVVNHTLNVGRVTAAAYRAGEVFSWYAGGVPGGGTTFSTAEHALLAEIDAELARAMGAI